MSDATTFARVTPSRPPLQPAPGWWILPMAFMGALMWAWLFSRLL